MKRIATNRSRLLTAVAAAAVVVLTGCGVQRTGEAMNVHGTDTDEATRARVDRLVAYCQKLSKAGEFYLASGMCGKAHDLDPTNPLPLLVMADNFEVSGEREQAMNAYRSILERHPQNVEAGYRLSKLELAEGYEAEAEQTVQASLEHSPDDSRLLNVLGVIKDRQGNHQMAQSYYRQALSSDPNNISVSNNLGLSLALSGQSGEAVDLLNQVVASPSSNETSRHNLALAYAAAEAEESKSIEKAEAVQESTPVEEEENYHEPVEIQSLPKSDRNGPQFENGSPLSSLFTNENKAADPKMATPNQPVSLMTSSFAGTADYNVDGGSRNMMGSLSSMSYRSMFLPGRRLIENEGR